MYTKYFEMNPLTPLCFFYSKHLCWQNSKQFFLILIIFNFKKSESLNPTTIEQLKKFKIAKNPKTMWLLKTFSVFLISHQMKYFYQVMKKSFRGVVNRSVKLHQFNIFVTWIKVTKSNPECSTYMKCIIRQNGINYAVRTRAYLQAMR